jgi:hypothetical protein
MRWHARRVTPPPALDAVPELALPLPEDLGRTLCCAVATVGTEVGAPPATLAPPNVLTLAGCEREATLQNECEGRSRMMAQYPQGRFG